MPSLGPRLPLSGSGGGRAGPQPARFPLVFAQFFVLWVGPAVPKVRAFHGKVLSLSLSFSLSLAIPLFGLLSHFSFLRLSSGHSGLVPTLSNAAYASLFSPHLLVSNVSDWATSPLEVARRHIICGFYLFIYFSSQLSCPLRFQNAPQTRQWEGFLVFGKFYFMVSLWDGTPSLPLLLLFLCFIFCPTSFWRQWAAFLGAWCPLPEFRSCFVKFAQSSNNLSMNLWSRKWSPHPIPPPS